MKVYNTSDKIVTIANVFVNGKFRNFFIYPKTTVVLPDSVGDNADFRKLLEEQLVTVADYDSGDQTGLEITARLNMIFKTGSAMLTAGNTSAIVTDDFVNVNSKIIVTLKTIPLAIGSTPVPANNIFVISNQDVGTFTLDFIEAPFSNNIDFDYLIVNL